MTTSEPLDLTMRRMNWVMEEMEGVIDERNRRGSFQLTLVSGLSTMLTRAPSGA
jgi:hypothetical protein